jgi:hypothetical protein
MVADDEPAMAQPRVIVSVTLPPAAPRALARSIGCTAGTSEISAIAAGIAVIMRGSRIGTPISSPDALVVPGLLLDEDVRGIVWPAASHA